jgi:hypothetical protein
MAEDKSTSRPSSLRPFNYGRRQLELAEVLKNQLSEAIDHRRNRMISDENAHSYRHGREWSLSHSPEAQGFSKLEEITAETAVPFKDIVDHRLSAIGEHINALADQFDREFTKGIFSLIDTTTTKTGKIVQFSGDIANDFIKVLETIELGCDRYGRPSMPSLHTSPEYAERIIRQMEREQPTEFWERLELLRSEKEKAATAREAERVSRFRW